MIYQSDVNETNTLIQNDEWLQLILFMQNEKELIKYNSEGVIKAISFAFRKMISEKESLISIDLNRIDSIIRKQYGHHQYIPANIGEQYLSQLGSLS